MLGLLLLVATLGYWQDAGTEGDADAGPDACVRYFRMITGSEPADIELQYPAPDERSGRNYFNRLARMFQSSMAIRVDLPTVHAEGSRRFGSVEAVVVRAEWRVGEEETYEEVFPCLAIEGADAEGNPRYAVAFGTAVGWARADGVEGVEEAMHWLARHPRLKRESDEDADAAGE